MTPAEEIKAKLDIVDLIREYVPLKQAGSNWKGLCPFHNEKTPSFMVSAERQMFHCFGCSEGGDIFTFVQKIEGADFPEALRILAPKAGVILRRQDPKELSRKARLLDAVSAAQKFFRHALEKAAAGEAARKYVAERKINDETSAQFGIGYAPDSWDALSTFLRSRGFKPDEILAAGLAVKSDKGGRSYDRFRHRLMFPLADAHGTVVGFTGRLLREDDKGGKYVNTPQSDIYDKGLVVYALDKAKQAAKEAGHIVVVEGQMDVIASHQSGVANVVAVSGTAMTDRQAKLLSRYAAEAVLCFDSDQAGEKAALRAMEQCVAQGMGVRAAVLPLGKDPDECVRADPEAWKRCIADAKGFVERAFDRALDGRDLGQVQHKKAVASELLPVIARLPAGVERSHYLGKLAGMVGVAESILAETITGSQRQSVRPRERDHDSDSPAQPGRDMGCLAQRARLLLALAIRFPDHFGYVSKHVSPEHMPEGELRDLYKILILYYTKHDDITPLCREPARELPGEAAPTATLIELLCLEADKDFAGFQDQAVQMEVVSMASSLRRESIRARLKQVEQQIRSCEQSGDRQRLEQLVREFDELARQLS